MTRYDCSQLAGSHDLRLPDWGPYTKRYMGISHIPDLQSGIRFDLSVFPALYRRAISPPNVTFESGYHPWAAASDLSYYRHRFELIWKDQLYGDVDFCRIDNQTTLIACELVNNTADPRHLTLHFMAYLNFPRCKGLSLRRGAVLARNTAIRPARIILPENARWIDALSYREIHFERADPAASLVYDGLLPGEIQDHDFVEGFGLGEGFGEHAGDRALYAFTPPRPMRNAVLLLRLRQPQGGSTKLALCSPASIEFELQDLNSLALHSVTLGALAAGEHRLEIVSRGGAPLEIDGYVICEQEEMENVRFETTHWNYAPHRIDGPHPHSVILKYDHVDTHYGLAWPRESFMLREILSDQLDVWLRLMVHNHRLAKLEDPDAREGHFTNAFVRPLLVPPNASRTFYGLVCNGTLEAVRARLGAFDPAALECKDHHHAARARALPLNAHPAGEPFQFSQDRMAATMLTSVVYPLRTRGRRIRHYTPGRWWDSVYTWDSGFVGLGLLELDIERAIDNLNAYVTEPGDPTAAFIHHGSPVPSQHYLFLELWNRTQSRAVLEYFYPRLRQYHQFLAGRLGSSTTRNLQSGLIRTWDYFYNSGGWDDLPPQVQVFQRQLFNTVTPVVSTAHVIRAARILRAAARALGEDSAEYDRDIAELSDALQKHSWDEPSGYFGYVVHDEQGRAREILRTPDGVNHNMTLDGAMPLVAGACSPEQESALVERLMTPGRIWSQAGLSAVDQSASYYREDGYWNGAVWMPYQWFFWKAMLDLGEGEHAFRIASTALQMWQEEVARSYNCYEHFPISSRQGAGWHHFGGLSSPVLSWFGAYYRPPRLTVGLDLWIEQLELTETSIRARLVPIGPAHRAPVVLAALAPGDYLCSWNGKEIQAHARHSGLLEIALPPLQGAGGLIIEKT